MDSIRRPDGQPLVFYHETQRVFDRFDLAYIGTGSTDGHSPEEAGFFFTPSYRFASRYCRGQEGCILQVHLKVAKTYEVTGQMCGAAEGLAPNDARDQGYDRYRVTPYDPNDMWIISNPEQIVINNAIGKSATTEDFSSFAKAA